MAQGFITANLFNVPAWSLNDPVRVEIVVRQDGDARPDIFHGLVHEVKKDRLTIQYHKEDLSRTLDHIFIESVNAGETKVSNMRDFVEPVITP